MLRERCRGTRAALQLARYPPTKTIRNLATQGLPRVKKQLCKPKDSVITKDVRPSALWISRLVRPCPRKHSSYIAIIPSPHKSKNRTKKIAPVALLKCWVA